MGSDGKHPLKPSKKQKVKSDAAKSTTKKSLARQAAMICAVTIGFCVIGYFGWQKLLEWDNIRFEKLRNTQPCSKAFWLEAEGDKLGWVNFHIPFWTERGYWIEPTQPDGSVGCPVA